MTSEQHSPNATPEQPDTRGAVPEDGQPDTRGAVPANGQPAPADGEGLPTNGPGGDVPVAGDSALREPAAPAAPAPVADASVAGAPTYREVTVRRAPKFVPFMAVGAILGFLAALVLAYTGPVDPTLTRESLLGFFTVAFAIPGLILAGLLVLIFDRRSVKKAERARAERTFDDDAA